MKYVQPYGIADPDAPYINGDPSIARQGSIPPAEAFEHPMREIVSVIDYSLLTPAGSDLEQLPKAVRSQRMNYAEDTGSVNTLSVAFDPPIANYTIGLPLRVKVRTNCTGPSTIDAGGGRVSIKKPSGAEMAADDLRAGGLAELVYDGTSFQMINFGGAGGGTGSVTVINIPYVVDTGTVNNIVANFSPAITAIQPGTIVMVKVANTNTSLTTININGLGPKPISAQGGTPEIPLLPTDIMINDVLLFTYDGTRFWLNPNLIINASCTFNVANTADIDLIFKALARKRIQPTVTVTIKMATGIYQKFSTYHVDASRITIEGTMLAANPVVASFARTGSAAAARANDAANNIVMLRSRYGSEIRWDNSAVPAGGGVINVTGPGQITFKNILFAGPNTPHADPISTWAIGGANYTLLGCSVWGGGGVGALAGGGATVLGQDSFICACSAACWANGGGTLTMLNCGAFGGSINGVSAGNGGLSFMSQGTTVQCHAQNGVEAISGGTAWIGTSCVSTSNGGTDAYAYNSGTLSIDLTHGAVVGTSSPAYNTTGNLGSSTSAA